MLQLIQPIASLFVGLSMFVYGLIHSITRYPGAAIFAQLLAGMPAAGSVLLFVLGLLAIIAGLVLLIVGTKTFRDRWSRFGQIARHVQREAVYEDDEGWEPSHR